MKKYIEKFFEELEMYDDKYRGQNNKAVILKNILFFLQNSSYNNAFEVYRSYFEAYRIGSAEKNNPFIELITNMSKYEQASGSILVGQRDHLVHSLNVFLLGICVYISIEEFRTAFDNSIKKEGYMDAYPTKHEEFFYRWGITALFHDIAYPLEISLKQLHNYAEVLNQYLNEEAKFSLAINFKNIDSLYKLENNGEMINENINKFYEKYNNIDKKSSNTIDLLSERLEQIFNIPKEDLKQNLEEKRKVMESGKYIDHGFYSALICLKWYYNLYKNYKWNFAFYYYPVVDSATAILLHNHFGRGIKDEFKTDKLSVEMSPMSFLLILCDELQEWDRITFSSNEIDVKNSGITLNDEDNMLNIRYTAKGNLEKLQQKKEKIESLLETDGIINLKLDVLEG